MGTEMKESILEAGFERYLVKFKDGTAATVNASSFADVLAELLESGKNEDDVIIIEKIDYLI